MFYEISLFEENFASTIYNIQSTLNLWSVKGLKLTVLKTLIIPKLIHKALHLPSDYQNNLSSNRIEF